MPSAVEHLQFHLVFSTKYRYRLIDGRMADNLKTILLKKQKEFKITIKSLEIEPDHIHMLFKVPSSKSDLNKIVQRIKGFSSWFLRKKYPHLRVYSSLWTPAHFLGSVGAVSDDTIKKYLDAQGIEEKEIVRRTFKYAVQATGKQKAQLTKYFKACLSNAKTKVPAGIRQDFTFHKGWRKGESDVALYLRAALAAVKVENNILKYKIPGGRRLAAMWLELRGRELPPDVTLKDSVLRKEGRRWFLHLVIEQERVVPRIDRAKVISVDLGMTHPITAAVISQEKLKEETFLGSEMKALKWRRERRRAQLQHSGIKDISSNLKKFNNRIKKTIEGYINSIVQKAKTTKSCILIGNVHGINKKFRRGKSSKFMRKQASNMPYSMLMQRLWAKAVLENIPVAFVNEHYTSVSCSRCGLHGSRIGQRFSCSACGYQNQADVNGAVNIFHASANLLSPGHWAPRAARAAECKPTASAVGL